MKALKTLPIELLIAGRPCAVVGADAMATAKIQRLLDADALVTVFTCGEPLPHEQLARGDGVTLCTDRPTVEQLREFVVVFVSPVHEALGAELHCALRAQDALLCVLDRPELSTFVNPAVVRAASVGLRLFSGGRAPALVRRLREDLEAALNDQRLAAFTDALAAMRSKLPRGDRAQTLVDAVRGLRLVARWEFPEWFTS